MACTQRESRQWAQWAVAGSVAIALGCTRAASDGHSAQPEVADDISQNAALPTPAPAPDNIRPELIGATLWSGYATLTFSEPLASVEHVDPGQFRLSLVRLHPTGVSYADLSAVGNDDFPLRVAGLRRESLGSVLRLGFSADLPRTYCERVHDAPGGAVLHYNPHGPGEVVDLAGNPLRGREAFWAATKAETAQIPMDPKQQAKWSETVIFMDCINRGLF